MFARTLEAPASTCCHSQDLEPSRHIPGMPARRGEAPGTLQHHVRVCRAPSPPCPCAQQVATPSAGWPGAGQQRAQGRATELG